MQKRLVPVVAIAVSLAVAAAIAWTVPKLRVRAEALSASRAVLQILEAAPADGPACKDKELVGKLVGLLSLVDADSGYWRLPASSLYTGAGAAEARGVVDEGLRQVVMPDIACRLERRARDLARFRLASEAAQWNGESTALQADALSDYLKSVADLETAQEHLQAMASPGRPEEIRGQVFADLIAYAYGELPAGFSQSGTLAGDAARAATGVTFYLPEEFRQRVAASVEESMRTLRLRLEHDVQAGPGLLRQMRERKSADTESRAQRWLAWVKTSWLAAGETANPCETMRLKIDADAALLVAQYGYPSSLGDAPDVFDAAHCHAPLMKFLAGVQVPPYGPLLQKEGDGSFTLNPALR